MQNLRQRRLIFLAVAVFATVSVSRTQQMPSAAEQFRNLTSELRKARDQKDWQSYLLNSQKLSALEQGAPRTHLQLALAELRAGDHQKAFEELRYFAQMGQAVDLVAASPDFSTIREDPRFKAMSDSMAANQAPISHASIAFDLAEAGLVPEDIDYDPHSSRFFLTSVQKKKIISVDANGKAEDFAQSPDSWPMMALKIDSRRRLLWATEVALNGFNSVPKSDWGRSAVLCYDLQTRKLVRRIEGPSHSALGDAVLTNDGDLIVSDGEGGGIYRVPNGGKELQRMDKGDFISPQTPVMHPDGRHVFVPDYLRGIAVFDLKTGQVRWIAMANKYALNGIDGLYFHAGILLAVQNGTSPERVSVFKLDRALSSVVSEEEIERSTPTLGDPTHGVIVHHEFYYIANSGWDTLDDNGNPKADAKPTPAHIMRAHIPPNAAN